MCKYWTGSPKGCHRKDSTCQYLHFNIGKEVNSEMNNHSTQCDDSRYDQDGGNDLNTNDETCHIKERPNSCDNRDFSQDTGDTLQSHRRSKDYGLWTLETEESYFATMGTDGRIRFTCKICDESFPAQKAVKQHEMAKHRREGSFKSMTS